MDSKENDRRARAIVQSLAYVIESMIQPHDSMPTAYSSRTKFEAFRPPGISVRDYLLRIQKYASCSAECFVLALVYIDRLHQMQGVSLTELNVHRVLITSVVLAAKFFDDHYFNNAYYAKVGGVPCNEMNELEVEFLIFVNFTLHVSTDTYERYYNELANQFVQTSYHTSIGRQLRHYVVMDPEQDGQLIYVTEEEELEAAPQPDYNEYQEAEAEVQQQQQQQQYQQVAEVAYAYQPSNPYANDASQYYQPSSGHQVQQHHQSQYQYRHQNGHFNQAHHSDAANQATHTGDPRQALPTAYVNGKLVPSATANHPYQAAYTYGHPSSGYNYDQRVSVPVSNSSSKPAVSSASGSSNGMVYASSSRQSGQKRRQSVALGVNA